MIPILKYKNDWPHWKELLAESITTPAGLSRHFPVDRDAVRQVSARYPMRINPYYLSLIREPDDPLWKQAVPDLAEIHDGQETDDPLAEEKLSPVPNLIHRYPDRVVFEVSSRCALFCRHCMRKRKVGHPFGVTGKTIQAGTDYIRKTPSVRDVILSGGDPLLLEDERLREILAYLREIPHVEIIRIHTRVPCTLPQRVTPELAQMLRAFHPLYINTHFNHPREITPEAGAACALLADAGIPLGCQSVLLRGVNDTPAVMKRLMQKLLMIRVKPYYIHQGDLVQGTGHFHTSPETGLRIMDALRGHTSGMCVPQYMIDLPGGGGKIPLLPEYILEKKRDFWRIRTYDGRVVKYPLTVRGGD
ncbi:KamA family radical SAM protein [Desulfonema ishimotonii]|uniref:KamA family radical SAM protein n=1 Tax=Desulfonema ishimotonii TaxID=45657 RepID=A0A401G228_9BACT|nr:KamA family radical SAM protein [Desulfonema ishimotonii]GBC63256.1 KamA family radical SAM protein [Desulfonema ishimotonii]